jgi:transcription elongation factor GreA
MANYTYLTQGGYDKLRAELDELKSTGRKEAAMAIAEARAQGDLSENAEYDAAKDAQGLLEMKINELETVMSNARVIDESLLDDSKVAILSNVTIKNLKTGKEMTYKLVSETEADAKLMKNTSSVSETMQITTATYIYAKDFLILQMSSSRSVRSSSQRPCGIFPNI